MRIMYNEGCLMIMMIKDDFDDADDNDMCAPARV